MRMRAAGSAGNKQYGSSNMNSNSDSKAATGEKAEDEDVNTTGHSEKKIKFRNYQPYDRSLALPRVPLEAESEHGSSENEEKGTGGQLTAVGASTDMEAVYSSKSTKGSGPVLTGSELLKAELEEAKGAGGELNIVPRKPNWDLKEQVAGQLDRLRRRTQRAIVDILKDKLAQEDAELD